MSISEGSLLSSFAIFCAINSATSFSLDWVYRGLSNSFIDRDLFDLIVTKLLSAKNALLLAAGRFGGTAN